MDWFLYDNGLRHERIKLIIWIFIKVFSWITLAQSYYKTCFKDVNSLHLIFSILYLTGEAL